MELHDITSRLKQIESTSKDDDVRFLATMVSRLIQCIALDSTKVSMLGKDSVDLQADVASLKDAIRNLGGDV